MAALLSGQLDGRGGVTRFDRGQDFAVAAEARLIAGRELDRPATIVVHYADAADMGPMLGLVHVIRHDADGGLDIERRPVIIQADDGANEVGSPTNISSR